MQSTRFWLAGLLSLLPSTVLQGQIPQVHDDRLELTLVAEHPDIVTPIGMVIDQRDRLFVIESHTHTPPAGYDGPDSDRIKIFEDSDGDGTFDSTKVFAEGLDAAMNLAWSPDGVLYAVCARDVIALPDTDGDDICDGHQQILKLVTEETYPHSCLLSITFGPDGWLYVGRGNTGSRHYSLDGLDGSHAQGYGDGGSIARCRPDGTQVHEFATGFWNPFDISFDENGRLLCVDNDPDGRGPNRVVHVVSGGDYGYKSLYGGSGNHPFQGWNGDLPGVLPIVSGTGEAPSGILDCRRARLPESYASSLLVTVWNENTIERHEVQKRGTSIVAERSVLVRGGKEFRPVALDVDSNGNIYFTDWVLVAYPNHGQGRIWKLSTKSGVPAVLPRKPQQRVLDDPELATLNTAFETGPQRNLANWQEAASSNDPFLRHAATVALAREEVTPNLDQLAADADPAIRLSALLAARLAGKNLQRHTLRSLLADPDVSLRRATLMGIGLSMDSSLRNDIDIALQGQQVTGDLFKTYLAAAANLNPDFARQYRQRAKSKSNQLPRPNLDGLLQEIVADSSYGDHVRSLAISHLNDLQQPEVRRLLARQANEGSLARRLAAVRQLSSVNDTSSGQLLLKLASDTSLPASLRTEALASLARSKPVEADSLSGLLEDELPEVATEAARTLRQWKVSGTARAQAEAALKKANSGGSERLAEQLAFVLGRSPTSPRPTTLEEWQAAVAKGGDAASGRRVFNSVHATCTKCHTIGQRGGTLGPELTNVAQSVTREQIVHSILRPSDKFPPQYQAWNVITVDGKVHTGLQLDHKARGAIELFTTDNKTVRFSADEIDEYLASPQSVMPNGLEANLGVLEFRDLVAYLVSLK